MLPRDRREPRRASDWTTIERLLVDAKMLAAYCERTARLKDDALPRAIAAVEKLENKSWSDDAAVELQTALNDALKVTAPITLVDIRSGWNPDDTVARKIKRNIVFVGMSFLLMLMAAIYTVHHNQATSVASALETLVAEEPAARIDQIARALIVSEAEFVQASDGDLRDLGPEKYFSDISELRTLNSRISQLTEKALASIDASYTPFDAAISFIGYAWTRATIDVEGGLKFEDGEALDTLPTYRACSFEPPPVVTTAAAEPLKATAEPLPTVAPPLVNEVLYERYRSSVLQTLCKIGSEYTPFDIPPLPYYMREVSDRTNWLGIWFLPALYGAFGAMIYYMRRVLDPNLPDPPIVRMLHRIALGAFSGIILAWFWAPTRISPDLANIGLNVFAAAFIVGFSADVFFAFLDRMVFLLTRWIRALGTTEKS